MASTLSSFELCDGAIEGVSLATWTLFVLMGVFWIIYGIDQRSIIIVLVVCWRYRSKYLLCFD